MIQRRCLTADPTRYRERVLLAIEDFVPVILSGVGLWLIADAVASLSGLLAGWARIGAVAAFAGGLSKATHKLILAATETDVRILDHALFPLLATGFALVATSVWLARRQMSATVLPWIAPAVLLTGGAAWAAGLSDRIFLLIATVASITLSALLIRWSASAGSRAAAWLFAAALALTLVLGGMAPTLGDAPEYQWLEQGTNTVTQGLFLYGSWLLARRIASRPTPLHTSAV